MPIMGPLFRLVSNFRDSDAFRIRRIGCSMPIAMAPSILIKMCYTFVGVFNPTDWPICALNMGRGKNVVYGDPGAGPVETSRFRYGAGKMQIRGQSVSTIIGVWGLEGAANRTS